MPEKEFEKNYVNTVQSMLRIISLFYSKISFFYAHVKVKPNPACCQHINAYLGTVSSFDTAQPASKLDLCHLPPSVSFKHTHIFSLSLIYLNQLYIISFYSVAGFVILSHHSYTFGQF